MEKYRFNKEEHIHELNVNGEWKPLMGVSSVVKDMVNYSVAAYYGSRRCLMALGYDPKEAKNDITEAKKCLARISASEDKNIAKELYNAYTAHAKYSKDRAKKGTDAHAVVEEWIKKCIETNKGKPLPSEDPVIKKFRELTDKYEPTFVASEKHGYNEDLWIGGITDVIAETNIGLGIWDCKNRPAIYEKDFLQCGGYAHLFPMDFTHVLGVPLEGNEAREFRNVPRLKEAFKSQLDVYKFMQSFKV
jgi:hypothetical protein